MEKVNIFWFRRDLRLNDNAGLYYALKSERPVIPVFIFDKNILNDLEDKADRRVEFIHEALSVMQARLAKMKSSFQVYHDFPKNVFKELLSKYDINTVFTNHDYEQYAIDRDEEIRKILKEHKVNFYTYKDQVIFEKDEVVKDDGTPYTVFTPYSKKWKACLNSFYLKPYPTAKYFDNFYKQKLHVIPTLQKIGFEKVQIPFPKGEINKNIITNYTKQRDFPAIHGTSKLGVYLRFGVMSIRHLAQKAKELNETYLNELIWREFYQMILWQFAHVRKGHSFKKEYDKIEWRNSEREFVLWCSGKTGYPIVDAGMRELNATGFIHNRVRMIVASFLTKQLLTDWRWGEAYFAKKLLDYEYASNSGGWQWAAGSGCDAAPYFRIFNPSLQTKKFDKDLKYIKKWVPELESFEYPLPIVDYDMSRKRALAAYAKALKK